MYSEYRKYPSWSGATYWAGQKMNATTNARPASPARVNQNATARSARFSARVPLTGHGSGYSMSSTPSSFMPSRTSSSRSIRASSSSVGVSGVFSSLIA